jgi:hypothetical protein
MKTKPPTEQIKKITTAEKLFALQCEKDLRCGNGTGKTGKQTYTHSTNCACEHLDPLIKMLEYNLTHD